MNAYTHLGMVDLSAAVDSLPAPTNPTAPLKRESQALAATGTDSAASSLVGVLVGESDGTHTLLPFPAARKKGGDEGEKRENPLNSRGFDASNRVVPSGDVEALPGIEPGYDGFAIRCLSAWLKGRTNSIDQSRAKLKRELLYRCSGVNPGGAP